MDAYVGQIMLFPGPKTPVNWLECNGAVLPIADYNILYSLLGTVYGGDGRTTFGIPDLRSRIPIGQGQGPGLSNQPIGSVGGAETVTLQVAEMPAHTHQAYATSAAATTNVPANNNMLAATRAGAIPNGTVFYFNPPASSPPTPAAMGTGTISQTPIGGQPHNNLMPYTALRYLICFYGLYPQPPSN